MLRREKPTMLVVYLELQLMREQRRQETSYQLFDLQILAALNTAAALHCQASQEISFFKAELLQENKKIKQIPSCRQGKL